MKQVTIKGPYIEGTWTFLDSLEALSEYMKFTTDKVVDQTKRLIKSNAGIDRWDHMITRSDEGSILAATLVKCKIQGKNPILELDGMIQDKFLTMFSHIANGRKLLVNHMGGYCFMEDKYEIVSESEIDTGFQPTHVINDNTLYINLENDPELEARTQSYLKALDPNFSYILNLHKYSNEKLVSVFKEFMKRGGKVVHVYTTGTNVPQMYEYFEAARLAGLNEFEFEFNSGITDGIAEFITHVKASEVAFKLID